MACLIRDAYPTSLDSRIETITRRQTSIIGTFAKVRNTTFVPVCNNNSVKQEYIIEAAPAKVSSISILLLVGK
jgi:hypothetical protein